MASRLLHLVVLGILFSSPAFAESPNDPLAADYLSLDPAAPFSTENAKDLNEDFAEVTRQLSPGPHANSVGESVVCEPGTPTLALMTPKEPDEKPTLGLKTNFSSVKKVSGSSCDTDYSPAQPPKGMVPLLRQVTQHSACKDSLKKVGENKLIDLMVCTVYGESDFHPHCSTGSHYSFWQMKFRNGNFTDGIREAGSALGYSPGKSPNFNWDNVMRLGGAIFCQYHKKCTNASNPSGCRALINIYEAVKHSKFKSCLKTRANARAAASR